MMVWLLFIIDLMGLFFYNKIGSIISIGDLPTTNIIEPFFLFPECVIIVHAMAGAFSAYLYSSKISSNCVSFYLQPQNNVLSNLWPAF